MVFYSQDEVMRKHKDEIDDLESKIKELEVFSYSIIRDNKILRKDLAKANMMLRTQQVTSVLFVEFFDKYFQSFVFVPYFLPCLSVFHNLDQDFTGRVRRG